MSTLIICEKANAADKISYFLSNGKSSMKRVGRVKVHSFTMMGEEYFAVGLRGHVVAFDYPKKYNDWKNTRLDELVNTEPIRQVTAKDITSALGSVRPSTVIVATDFDREGELIGVEALDLIGWPPETALRAKFSALTGEEIRTAFANLVPVDTNLADAGMARQYIDLAWGAVLTRFISLTTGKMGKEFLSVGRVQTPTLAIVVDREKEIQAFVPTPYWEVNAFLGGEEFRVDHENNPFWEEMGAIKAKEKASGVDQATVSKLDIKKEPSRPPVPFNTTLFLMEATKLGLGARQAMDIAEELYMAGWLSYPRTDNTVYPRSLSLKGVLEKLAKGAFSKEAKELLAQKSIRPTRGKTQTTDHPPIYPVKGAKEKDLQGMKWKVYELVARRFMATVAPYAEVEKTNADFDLNEERFIAESKKILFMGWKAYYPYYKLESPTLPDMKEGEKFDITRLTKARKHTKPPSRYSQGSLILAMEKLNLGTKSTRHEIIQKLFDRGYLRKPLVPTPIGIALVDTLKEGAEEMTHHDMTATLEEEMTNISQGEKKLGDVVDDSRKMLSKVLSHLERSSTKVRETMLDASKEERHVGGCPKCGGDLMVLKPGKKRFVGCANYPACKNTYPLPQQGRVAPTHKVCQQCGAPIVRIISKGRRPWEICLNMECPSKKPKTTSAKTTSAKTTSAKTTSAKTTSAKTTSAKTPATKTTSK